MSFIRNAWYAAMWGESLAAGELHARTILDIPLVFFRREDGAAATLRDACPHRFAPLSAGKLLPGDRLQCKYHGLQFHPSGECALNPHGSGRIPPACRVPAFPVVEKHTMLWVWMGAGPAAPEKIPDYSFLDPDSGYAISKRDHVVMEANYRLVVNNLMDLSHVPLLHEGLLTHPDAIQADISIEEQEPYVYVERRMRNVTPGVLQDLLFRRDGRPIDTDNKMRWSPPGNLLNQSVTYPPGGSPGEGAGLLGAHILTPIGETKTMYHFAATRTGPPMEGDEGALDEARRKMSELRRFAFEQQDEPIIEAQQRYLEKFPDARPVLFEIDAAPVRCNRIIDSLLRDEAAVAALPQS